MAAGGRAGGEGGSQREGAGGGCGTAAAGTAAAAAAACSWRRLPGGGCWKLPGAAAVLCHIVSSPSRPLPPRRGGRADGESRVERRPLRPAPPGVHAPRPGSRRSSWAPAARAASAGRGARRRLSRDAPGHFRPKDWAPARGSPQSAAWVACGLPGGVEPTGVRPREEFGVFPERY